MKENQNKQNNHYFNEQWKEQAKLYARSKGLRIVNFWPERKEIWVRQGLLEFPPSKPAPIFMMKWAESNPYPDCSMMEFVYRLAQRVERLEAALAEKEDKNGMFSRLFRKDCEKCNYRRFGLYALDPRAALEKKYANRKPIQCNLPSCSECDTNCKCKKGGSR